MSILLAFASVIAAPVCPVTLPGAPVDVAIRRVKDGDTFEGTCRDRFGFPEVFRLLDLDTPEKAPRAKCPEEATLAKQASAFVVDLAKRGGMHVRVTVAPHKEKYGRYLASATFIVDGEEIEWREALIEGGYAFAYDGGAKADWCAVLKGAK